MKDGHENKQGGQTGNSQGQCSLHESVREPSTMRTESVNMEAPDGKREQLQPFEDLPGMPTQHEEMVESGADQSNALRESEELDIQEALKQLQEIEELTKKHSLRSPNHSSLEAYRQAGIDDALYHLGQGDYIINSRFGARGKNASRPTDSIAERVEVVTMSPLDNLE